MPKVFTTEELRLFQRKKDNNRSWGLVPTMGSLHQGHLKLIQKAHAENAVTFVTIFVNPTQFESKNDLENYPSTIDDDVEKIHAIDPNICVFIPSIKTIYPMVLKQKVCITRIGQTHGGMYRPGHFDGVATVVERLFTLVQPDVAYLVKRFSTIANCFSFGKTIGVRFEVCQPFAKPMDLPRALATVACLKGGKRQTDL